MRRKATSAGIALWLAFAALAVHAESPAALDCDRLSPRDIREVLAPTAAPRVIAISGSLDVVTMDSFARFLVAMGYPADRIRNPADGKWSYSSMISSAIFAGMIAWDYEHDGTMPLLVGYSGGGMLAVRTLHELAGAFASHVTVVDAQTGEPLARDSIVDPATGRARPALGLKVPYACALATGTLPRVLLGQWTMIGKLHEIPDTVDEFTGFVIEWDIVAGTFPGSALRRNRVGACPQRDAACVVSARRPAANGASRYESGDAGMDRCVSSRCSGAAARRRRHDEPRARGRHLAQHH